MERYYKAVGGVVVVTVSLFILGLIMSGCATQLQHDPLYDGGAIVVPTTDRDSATFVRVTILNNRISDASDPHFYLTGTGRHSLGIVGGMGGKKILFVDTSWLDPMGCFSIAAHYVGVGDFTFPPLCWKRGFVVDVALQELMNTSTAWSHR